MSEKILRPKEVAERLCCTRQHLHNLVREGRFPKPLSLFGKRRIGWRESTIDAHIAALPEKRITDGAA
jgi:predicted DNA-binding transcriptional regulator AlpA